MKKLIILSIIIMCIPLTVMASERESGEYIFQIIDTNNDGKLSRSEFDMYDYIPMNHRQMGNSQMEKGEFSAFETEEIEEIDETSVYAIEIDDTWLPSEWSDPY